MSSVTIKTPRQRVWEAVREYRNDFTLLLVAGKGRMKIDACRDFLKSLRLAGFIEETHRVHAGFQRGNTAQVHYRLVKDCGVHAPSVDKRGNLIEVRAVNEAMWISLRINPQLNARTLSAAASTDVCPVSEETANSFLQSLNRAGYLDVVRTSSPGIQAVYRLKPSMNTGPLPPQIQRTKRVWDANLNREMFLERPELAEEEREGMTESEVCDVA